MLVAVQVVRVNRGEHGKGVGGHGHKEGATKFVGEEGLDPRC